MVVEGSRGKTNSGPLVRAFLPRDSCGSPLRLEGLGRARLLLGFD